MARNEEKHAGRLNRLWLQRLDEEKEKKNPPRPGLGSLKTAAEVKKWIPSIKSDIDFYLKQSQVTCYPERKLSEFSQQIERLSREYKAYLRKYRELCPSDQHVPWTDKPYSRKHKTSGRGILFWRCRPVRPSFRPSVRSHILEVLWWISLKRDEKSRVLRRKDKKSEHEEFIPLSIPVLEQLDELEMYTGEISTSTETPEVVLNVNPDTVDAPLDFNPFKVQTNMLTFGAFANDGSSTRNSDDNLCNHRDKMFGESNDIHFPGLNTSTTVLNFEKRREHSTNVLNIPYSDSSSDESDEDGKHEEKQCNY
ncbi:uncharacterized protein LOC127861399 isoform X2 [Dreissena polymorpha]|uniref:uncharacterized protein LOC127861399 isoform X2 n=1 Tax=Dreissena polymorpha TaxID=45954 RepID=UPI002264C08F|nr:uncharacterized protein LOC127861399 isoform X2 [Dreissena polymorpha]